MIIWGIDPGQKGGLARIHKQDVRVNSMPDLATLSEYLEADDCFSATMPPVHVWLEKAQSMPKQGIASAFSYGVHYGEIRGLLISKRIPFTEVRPQIWAREIHAGTKGGVAKARTLEAVKKLFPKVKLILPGCRVPHMGLVDALAIAEHGRRVLRA